jgi:hypothetical protein
MEHNFPMAGETLNQISHPEEDDAGAMRIIEQMAPQVRIAESLGEVFAERDVIQLPLEISRRHIYDCKGRLMDSTVMPENLVDSSVPRA